MEKTMTLEKFKTDWTSFFGIPDEEVTELMELFVQSMKASRDKLKKQLDGFDFIALAREAHSLKGLAGPDLDGLRDLARDLEIAAKAENPDESARFIEKILGEQDFLIHLILL